MGREERAWDLAEEGKGKYAEEGKGKGAEEGRGKGAEGKGRGRSRRNDSKVSARGGDRPCEA